MLSSSDPTTRLGVEAASNKEHAKGTDGILIPKWQPLCPLLELVQHMDAFRGLLPSIRWTDGLLSGGLAQGREPRVVCSISFRWYYLS